MVEGPGGNRFAGPITAPSSMSLPRGWKPKITLRSIPERSLIKEPFLLEFSPKLLRVIPAGEEIIGTQRFLNANPQNVYGILGRIRPFRVSTESLLEKAVEASGTLTIKFFTADNWQIASLPTFRTRKKDQILFMTNEFRPVMSEISPVLGVLNDDIALVEFQRFLMKP